MPRKTNRQTGKTNRRSRTSYPRRLTACRHGCGDRLWPFNPKTMSLLGYPKVIPYTKFEHFWIIRFWILLRVLVWKIYLLILWPWPLTFQPQIISFLGYLKVILYTKFEHFEIFRFWVMLRTNRQTDELEYANHADRLCHNWMTGKRRLTIVYTLQFTGKMEDKIIVT